MSKIFTSQSNFNMGRGRQNRRLNAILDNQQQIGSNNIPNPFSSVDTGEGEVSKSDTIDSSFQPSPVYICPHSEYCNSPHKYSMKCNFNQDCRIKKFYDKWGEDGNSLGI